MGTGESVEFTYEVRGKPVPKGRPRFFRGHAVTPAATRKREKLSASVALAARPEGWPLDAYYRAEVWVYLPDRRRGDLDNYGKLELDALDGVAWSDDCRVHELTARRCLDAANPRVVVRVETIPPCWGADYSPPGKSSRPST